MNAKNEHGHGGVSAGMGVNAGMPNPDKPLITEGATVEEAVESALTQLGVARDQVSIAVHASGRRGILGLGAKPAVVAVSLRNDPAMAGNNSDADGDAEQVSVQAPAGDPDTASEQESTAEPATDAAGVETATRKSTAPQETDAPQDAPDGATEAPAGATDDHQPQEGKPQADSPAADKPRKVEPERPGKVAIGENGVIEITPPSGKGRLPIIHPGQNVVVKVNDQVIEGAASLKPEDKVELVPEDVQPSTRIEVSVSEDELTATMAVIQEPGIRREVKRTPAFAELTPVARDVERIEAPPASYDRARKALADHGVIHGIDDNAVQEVVAAGSKEPRVVAQGEAAVPPVHGRIELFFPNEPKPVWIPPDETLDTVDPLDQFQLPSVKSGEPLARWHPPQTGRQGRNVRGKVLAPDEPREQRPIAGEGTELIDDGNGVASTRAGRPMLNGTTLTVAPTYVLQGDVALDTGHLKFDGDVIVQGDVSEQMKVRAGGMVAVNGNVNHGSITAAGSVHIKANLIGGEINAGDPAAVWSQVYPMASHIREDLENLLQAVQGLQDSPALAQMGLQEATDGRIVFVLLDTRFPRLPRLVKKFAEVLKEIETPEELDMETIAADLNQYLTAVGPLSIRRLDQVSEIWERLDAVIDQIEARRQQGIDTHVGYVQNGRIWASGKVHIQGAGSYGARIHAGSDVTVNGKPGIFRGGSIQAGGRVFVRDLGVVTVTLGPTQVEVPKDGVVEAEQIHPGVHIQLGRRQWRCEETLGKCRIYLDEEGEVQVEELRAKPAR